MVFDIEIIKHFYYDNDEDEDLICWQHRKNFLQRFHTVISVDILKRLSHIYANIKSFGYSNYLSHLDDLGCNYSQALVNEVLDLSKMLDSPNDRDGNLSPNAEFSSQYTELLSVLSSKDPLGHVFLLVKSEQPEGPGNKFSRVIEDSASFNGKRFRYKRQDKSLSIFFDNKEYDRFECITDDDDAAAAAAATELGLGKSMLTKMSARCCMVLMKPNVVQSDVDSNPGAPKRYRDQSETHLCSSSKRPKHIPGKSSEKEQLQHPQQCVSYLTTDKAENYNMDRQSSTETESKRFVLSRRFTDIQNIPRLLWQGSGDCFTLHMPGTYDEILQKVLGIQNL